MRLKVILLALILSALAEAGQPENVLVVMNGDSKSSRSIGEYYARRRSVPPRNLCTIRTPESETISRDEYNRLIKDPVAACLKGRGLVESILYIVTTQGVPLRVKGVVSLTG